MRHSVTTADGRSIDAGLEERSWLKRIGNCLSATFCLESCEGGGEEEVGAR